MHVKIKLISTVMACPFISISRTGGDIASGMDNECVMNLYDNELDGMKFWITYGHNGQIMLLYNSYLDD
jgi:hypothetical protein